MKKLMFLTCLLLMGCSLFGGINYGKIKEACKQALKETKIEGEVNAKTGELKAGFINNATPSPGTGNAEGSMVLKLLNMIGAVLILAVLLTWIGVLWLRRTPVGVIVKPIWLTVIINALFLIGWEGFIWLGWAKTNWLDAFFVVAVAWGLQMVAYDKFGVKKALKGKGA